VATVLPLEPIAVGIVVAVVFFAWGWARAARFRSERGKSPWAIPPTVWGAIHVVALPVGWLIYAAASRTTKVPDFSLTHRPDSANADTAEERARLRNVGRELPLLRPPQPETRGWHADPLEQRSFRFFDGSDGHAMSPTTLRARQPGPSETHEPTCDGAFEDCLRRRTQPLVAHRPA